MAERLPDSVAQQLSMTAEITISDLTAHARDEFADLDRWPLAQIVEVLDERTCPLCEHVDGMILDRRSAEYERWKDPSHINCRRTIAYIAADEVEIDEDGQPRPVEPDFVEPPDGLIDKHGHFVRDPEKYAPLRIPAQPEGRDFVFTRMLHPETGEMVSVMKWRVRSYEIPGLHPDTIHIEQGGKAAQPWYPSEDMENALRTQEPQLVRELGNGVTGAQRARVGEYDVCYKPEPPPDDPHYRVWNPPNEEAAYLVARALGIGLVLPTAARETAQGKWTASAQLWDEQGRCASSLVREIEAGEDLDGSIAEMIERSRAGRDAAKLAWFDGIIGNHDRNWGNILVDVSRRVQEEQRLVAVDHGLTFFPTDFYASTPVWVRDRDELVELRQRLQDVLDEREFNQRLRYLLDDNQTDAMREMEGILGAKRYNLFRETVISNIGIIDEMLEQLDSGIM